MGHERSLSFNRLKYSLRGPKDKCGDDDDDCDDRDVDVDVPLYYSTHYYMYGEIHTHIHIHIHTNGLGQPARRVNRFTDVELWTDTREYIITIIIILQEIIVIRCNIIIL